MDKTEISILRTLGYGLAETSERSDGAIMTVGAARELGRLIMEMVSDNQRMAGGILEMGRERDSLREKYEKALTLRDRVIEEIQEVKKERDSLKAKVDGLEKSCSVMLGQREEYRRERDKLQKIWEDVMRERDSLRERYEREMASFKESNARLSSLLDASVKERDSLREKLEGPLVKFALELDRQNKKLAQAMGGGVA